MCGALKILVCVASVLAITLASKERKKRDDYDSLSTSPWQSPTNYGFRPYNNYYDIPSTKMSRVNNYNPSQNGRNIQRNQGRNVNQASNLYSAREQNSDWIPITSNSNQQYYSGRYGQNGQQQQQRTNSYNNIRYNPSLDAKQQLVNERTRQRQPNYSVQTRGRPINQSVLREINGNFLIKSNSYQAQPQAFRNVNQGPRPNAYPRPDAYPRQAGNPYNNRVNSLHSTRANPRPQAIQGQLLRENVQRGNQGYPLREVTQPIELNQDTLRDLFEPKELPAVEGRILGLNVQQVEPVKELVRNNGDLNIENLRVINSGDLIRSNQLPVVQEPTPVENIQRPSGYAVQEINEDVPNQPQLKGLNTEQRIQANQLNEQRVQQEILSRLLAQKIAQNAQLEQTLRVANSDNLVRSEEIQEPQASYLRNNNRENIQSVYLRQESDSSDNRARYPNTLALIHSNQAVQGQILENSVRSQLIDQSSNQPRLQEVKGLRPNEPLINNVRFSQPLATDQVSNDLWRQERLSAQQEIIRNNEEENNPSLYLRQEIASSDNAARYPHTLALFNSNQAYRSNPLPVVRGQILENSVRSQLIDQSSSQPRQQEVQVIIPSELLSNNVRLSQQLNANQAPNDVWRQERLSAQSEANRNNEGLTVDGLEAQQDGNQNGDNQQPNVYTYAELTAKIWKVLKSNPAMMSNLDNLREQLLNERNSKNAQIRELRGLLEEARKYNRNSAINAGRQTLEQKERNTFVNELIDTMKQNEASSSLPDLRRQLTYLDNNRQRQGRYLVRPDDVNPLIKNILFATAKRNETQTENTSSVRPQGIVVRPSTNVPLPQLEISEPYGLDQLEHHYDLTQWKQATELLRGNPFLQSYNVLEHLV